MKLPIEKWLCEDEALNHEDEYVRGAARQFTCQHHARLDMLMARFPLAAARVRMAYAAYLEQSVR
jgi:hypothetical protein